MSARALRHEVAAVLAEHQRRADRSGACLCGEWPPPNFGVPWTDHVADALLGSPALARVIQEKQGDAWHQGWVAGCVDAFSDGPTTANPYWPPAGGPDHVDTESDDCPTPERVTPIYHEVIHLQVVVDTDELREWAGKHADAGRHGVAHVLYKAASDGESLTDQAMREATAELQSRLDAIAAYAGHPGNWSAGDSRGRLIRDLATGDIDPSSRDWSDTNLPAREDTR